MSKDLDTESHFGSVEIMTRAQIQDLRKEIDWTGYKFVYAECARVGPNWRTVHLLDKRQISYLLIPDEKKCLVFDPER